MEKSNISIRDEIRKHQKEQSNIPFDVNELLTATENEHTQYLTGHTIESISMCLYNSLVYRVPSDQIQPIYNKLAGFRLVDEVYLLHRGKYVRWIRNDTNPAKLETGGIVIDIKITDSGVSVLCKLGSRFTQYRFNECITYQKLSRDEMMVLTVYSALRDRV
jgi:hypothetical protein